ncbi:MAG: hypothetical protein U9P79_06060 [Candidatus Cloacimonadota bacterium]|nr:hypothetical protein [Candidatus Cloacimonadota bacterium]
MKVEVYCDESYPDLLSSRSKPAKYMVIGSVWLRWENRDPYKEIIHQLRLSSFIAGDRL